MKCRDNACTVTELVEVLSVIKDNWIYLKVRS